MFHWNADPILIEIGPLSLRWYGVLFAMAFYLGHRWCLAQSALYRVPADYADRLFLYVFAGTLLGARLGHCLFYEPEVYLMAPWKILAIWEGGLASHGAVIGILSGIWLFSRKHPPLSYLGVFDYIAAPMTFGAGLVRLGNFFNSEILGNPTEGAFGVVFERVDALPRHPAQLYEAISYFLIAAVVWRMQKREFFRAAPGRVIGLTFVLGMTARFVVEFFKMPQAAFEEALPFSMGQILSFPFFVGGVLLLLPRKKGS